MMPIFLAIAAAVIEKSPGDHFSLLGYPTKEMLTGDHHKSDASSAADADSLSSILFRRVEQ